MSDSFEDPILIPGEMTTQPDAPCPPWCQASHANHHEPQYRNHTQEIGAVGDVRVFAYQFADKAPNVSVVARTQGGTTQIVEIPPEQVAELVALMTRAATVIGGE